MPVEDPEAVDGLLFVDVQGDADAVLVVAAVQAAVGVRRVPLHAPIRFRRCFRRLTYQTAYGYRRQRYSLLQRVVRGPLQDERVVRPHHEVPVQPLQGSLVGVLGLLCGLRPGGFRILLRLRSLGL